MTDEKKDKTTVYGYYTVTMSNGKQGYVCVRVDRPPRDSKDTGHKASFAFCSPKDPFSRPIARTIADSRMTTTRVKAHVDFDYMRPAKLPELFEEALHHADAPGWFKRAKSIHFGIYTENQNPFGNGLRRGINTGT